MINIVCLVPDQKEIEYIKKRIQPQYLCIINDKEVGGLFFNKC